MNIYKPAAFKSLPAATGNLSCIIDVFLLLQEKCQHVVNLVIKNPTHTYERGMFPIVKIES
jgi:hypothetical protein